MPTNVKEFDNFFGDQLAIFVQISSKTVDFIFSKMLNFAILFVFVQNEFLVSLAMFHSFQKNLFISFWNILHTDTHKPLWKQPASFAGGTKTKF